MKTKEERAAYMSAWHAKNKDRRSAWQRKRYQERKGILQEQHRQYSRSVRNKVITHYGSKCVCCGEATNEFLAVDHVDGGGNEHRRSIPSRNVHRWLVQNNYPEGFQLLCHNCNMAKGFYGQCPHQKEVALG